MYGQQTKSTGQNLSANFSLFNLVGPEMRNKGLQAAVKQSPGVTEDLKKRTHSKSV